MNSTSLSSAAARKNQVSSETTLAHCINKLVERLVEDTHVPGYALTVVHYGQTVIQKGYGFADLETKRCVTPETVFGLASITKTFTALALLLLMDEGRVKAEDSLAQHLLKISPEWGKLTIEQLADMTAGIAKRLEPKELVWPEEMEILQWRPLDSPPGTQYSYSNPSYRTLGTVIEQVTGDSYMKFLRERVLDPLAMTDTGKTDDRFDPPIAVPYKLEEGNPVRVKHYTDPAINFAAGMLASNSVDMERYARALLARKLLSPEGYERFWFERPYLPDGKRSNWAYGWGNNRKDGTLRIGMNGGMPGVASSLLIFPEEELIVIGLANARGDGIHEIAHWVAAEVLGREVGEPEIHE
ncbi:MAG TPA: serine hydrolase domain-containing protein [Blastocatellia bacterium]|nr:serine hydrolase domain-containing protein [Blastocatellia bacterium]HMV82133.1 serine hydrolase domain-containing protein [Blastocatellia bacterium]HMX28285.1 serine hydrolase domain-containing protein [Blastocatellia bacterium]HMZ18585.1 serine hydrolase domain-containing protein [Blastocatellia bacterium]HNG29078.1 serine hydrolase domain-containing protein [Blastocatellia bacterium]